jgi:mRNA interferase MazF
MVERFDVYLVNLDAEPGRDARNTRPCVVISPNEMNRHLKTVIVAPLSASQKYPTRVPVTFLSNERVVVLDQIRTVDGGRLVKKIGRLDSPEQAEVLKTLAELFAE